MNNEYYRINTVGEFNKRLLERMENKKQHEESGIDYETTKEQLKMGMCVCNRCGKLCSTDYKWCSYCLKQVVVISKEKPKIKI